ncbi:MAG TPA: hypothetical protein EYP78_02730 [Candidatus Omnitrophica bacterium]|nr:hypothetical protein [Candidatus Omnitrophota bacterium]
MPHKKSTRNCIPASNKRPHEIEIELATFLKEGREEVRWESIQSFEEDLVYLWQRSCSLSKREIVPRLEVYGELVVD